jgi:hypothetical protein
MVAILTVLVQIAGLRVYLSYAEDDFWWRARIGIRQSMVEEDDGDMRLFSRY